MAVASYVSVANGLCCPSCPSSGQCADGTSCTSHMNCCATGPCNIFCCNCGGVCRRPSLLQSELPLAKIEADDLNMAIEHFGKFDIDKNGAIDIYELEMKQADIIMPVYIQESAFRRIDVNMDGMITIEEFDEDTGRALWEEIRQGVVNVGIPTPHLIAQTNFCVNCIAGGGPQSNCYHGLPGDVNGIGSDHSVQSYQATSFGKPSYKFNYHVVNIPTHACKAIILYRGLIRDLT